MYSSAKSSFARKEMLVCTMSATDNTNGVPYLPSTPSLSSRSPANSLGNAMPSISSACSRADGVEDALNEQSEDHVVISSRHTITTSQPLTKILARMYLMPV